MRAQAIVRGRAALLLALTLAAGCRAHAGTPAPGPPPIMVRVLNRTAVSAVVWVARDSVHWRLGAVDSAGRAEFPVPRSFLERRDSVRFLAFHGTDPGCVFQDARFATAGRKRFTVVLQREFPNPDPKKKEPCRWP